MKRCNTSSGKKSTTDFPARQRERGRPVRQRKVVTEITIETNQVLVIERKQVTRSRCSECASEAEFVRPDFVRPNNVNVVVDETWNQQVVEAASGASHFSDAAGGSHTIYRWSLVGATMLAKRFLSCLGRDNERESVIPRLKGQKSKAVDKARVVIGPWANHKSMKES
jgi:hypothetical protein